ncbi:MAG: 50S ribosomal protein L32 [Firmicutes bacterium]|nr:50S ribosomal protein L32 [Bacillota bacterium]
MSICPKGRRSKAKRDSGKASSWRVSTPTLVACSRCGDLMMPHRVCKSCGAYDKKTVVAVD